MDMYHDFIIHYGSVQSMLKSVDPDRYSYIDLTQDVNEHVLSHIPSNVGLALHISHGILDSTLKIDVKNDKDVLDMFEFNLGCKDIHIYVDTEFLDGPICSIGGESNIFQEDILYSREVMEEMLEEMRTNNMGFGEQVRSENVGSRGQEGTGNFNEENNEDESADKVDSQEESEDYRAEDNEDSEEDDGIYGFRSEDEDWKAEEGDKESSDSDSDSNDLVREEVLGEYDKNDGFSDYESNDESSSDDSEFQGHPKYMSNEQKAKLAQLKIHKHCKFGFLYKPDPMGKVKLEVGQLFQNVDHYREVLKDYAVQTGIRLYREKNERTRVRVKCKAEGCEWWVHASPLSDKITFQIKTMGKPHSCVRLKHNREATSTWISKKFQTRLKQTPDISITSLHSMVHEDCGVEASRMQLWRAKRKALENIEGNHGHSYRHIPAYQNEIMKSNMGSVVDYKCEFPPPDHNPTFYRMFISFEAMMTGFRDGCRPFIGLDGCHLKGPHGGILLAAIGLDGNNGLFPIAYGVVEIECAESWGYFLQHLHTVIGGGCAERPWTFMSDKQKGLERAMTDVFPAAMHRKCCRHIYSNFRKKHPGIQLKKLFWRAARAWTVQEFTVAMQGIMEIDFQAHTWLMNNAPTFQWSRHGFNPRVKSDHVTNNMTESFNNWIGMFRDKPILTLLEGIRVKIMERIQIRYSKGSGWSGMVTPNTKKKLNEAMEESRKCNVIFAGGEEYEVVENNVIRYTVHLGRMTCACKAWEISGIPCRHAVAAISFNRLNLEKFCDKFYTNEMYMQSHKGMIHPIPDQTLWEPVSEIIHAPIKKRLPGRPKKNRAREENEPAAGTSQVRRSLSIKCRNCGMPGHNKRGCKEGASTSKKQQKNTHPQNGNGTATGYRSQGQGTQHEANTSNHGSQPANSQQQVNRSSIHGRGVSSQPTGTRELNQARRNVRVNKLQISRGKGRAH